MAKPKITPEADPIMPDLKPEVSFKVYLTILRWEEYRSRLLGRPWQRIAWGTPDSIILAEACGELCSMNRIFRTGIVSLARAAWLTFVLMDAMITGCAKTMEEQGAIVQQVQSGSASAQATNLSGLWSGTTLVTPCVFAGSGRCNAQNKITLQLTDQNNQITGNYTCAYGNMICRHGGADNTGKIVSGRISGNQVRLSLLIPADVSNCYYNGMLPSATTMHGTYMCYNGAALVEEGIWDVKLASGQ